MKQLDAFPEVTGGAHFSADRSRRYSLWRSWGSGEGTVLWVMLNPSDADEDDPDPTVHKVVGFSQRWGFQGSIVGNLYDVVSSDPQVLRFTANPCSAGNDRRLLTFANGADAVILAWGAHISRVPGGTERGEAAKRLLSPFNCYHLGLTQAGHPRHPLYLPYSTRRHACRRS